MKNIILWGATGQAKVLRECLKHSGTNLVALFDNNLALASPFPDVPVYHGRSGFENWKRTCRFDEVVGFLVAIGGDRGGVRLKIQEYLQEEGLEPAVAIHPTAFVADNAVLGAGSQILANSAVCVESVIKRGCIVNTGATVDHECILDEGVHVAPGAHLAGCVTAGRCSMIGMGAVVLPRVNIGEYAVVGAGAVVTRDVPPYAVVVGNPARIIRTRTINEQG